MSKKIQVVDLFCGIGGLSHGFVREGFDVVAGIDNEESCRFSFEYNNKANFLNKDIRDVSGKDILKLYDEDVDIKILVGCAPCQPFSLMNINKGKYSQEDINKRSPIHAFAKLIEEVQPDIISMENVPGIFKDNKYDSFQYFIDTLNNNGYVIGQMGVIKCNEYGIPQTRKRFVLIAAKEKIGKITISESFKKPITTLKDCIGDLEHLSHGETSTKDRYHVARSLNSINLQRIKLVQKNGGSLQDIPQKYWPDCYKKKSGKSYINNVYGRMRWDTPAPTMTTFCTGYGNGRFGHPEQDRAISLREAARIQTFPDSYEFTPKDKVVGISQVSKQIGNAVPVRLGEIIARSIKDFII